MFESEGSGGGRVMGKTFVYSFLIFVLILSNAAYAAWSPSMRGLVLGGGFGFASGPTNFSGDDRFAGLGGYVFVGRELRGLAMLGGKFEGYVYDESPFGYSYDSGTYQVLFEVAVSSRFYPVGFYGLRPYVGGDVGIYVKMNRDDTMAVAGFNSRVEPGVTGRAGLEVFVVSPLAVDFGVSHSLDAAELNRLNVTTGYVGAVMYF
jgi:hypothetical protein